MRTLIIMIISVLMLLLVSCNTVKEERSPVEHMIVVNMDGTVECIFPHRYNDLDCHHGVIVPMHDNHRFVLYNENLFIMDSMHEEVITLLTDIEVDDEGYNPGREMISISYDDNYIAFTSENNLYCLNLIENEYIQLTSHGKDRYPAFGIDNRIYFARHNSEDENSSLMYIDLNGNNEIELCDVNNDITRILPGSNNNDIVYFVTDQIKFNQFNLSENEIYDLHEFEYLTMIISRTNDGRYFCFSNSLYNNERHYLFDTQTNTIQSYYYESPIERYISKVLPNCKKALIYNHSNSAVVRLWDIDTNSQAGEKMIIDNTSDTGLDVLAISYDASKFAIIHRIY